MGIGNVAGTSTHNKPSLDTDTTSPDLESGEAQVDTYGPDTSGILACLVKGGATKI